jgi:uncharacterized protein YlzI (FlbEa/FlbD family)
LLSLASPCLEDTVILLVAGQKEVVVEVDILEVAQEPMVNLPGIEIRQGVAQDMPT